jgi:hypothetical protein
MSPDFGLSKVRDIGFVQLYKFGLEKQKAIQPCSVWRSRLTHFLYCFFQLWQFILENIPDTLQIHT